MQTAIYPSLKDRAVFVSGGGSGIGEAIVRAFCAQGSKVAFADIDKGASERLVAELAGKGTAPLYVPCDLRDVAATQSAIRQAAEKLGAITALVNNAARDDRHAYDTVSSEYWDERIAVNLKHQFFCTQAVADGMKRAGGGSIVFFSSISWMTGMGGMPVYTAAKSGVLGLMRAFGRDLGPFNIRCNAIAPGWIMTERQQKMWLDAEGERILLERQCLKRKIYPEEIARLVLFLAADDSSCITNQTYVADGGWL